MSEGKIRDSKMNEKQRALAKEAAESLPFADAIYDCAQRDCYAEDCIHIFCRGPQLHISKHDGDDPPYTARADQQGHGAGTGATLKGAAESALRRHAKTLQKERDVYQQMLGSLLHS